MLVVLPVEQGRTLVHLSAQRKRFWWDKGYLGGVEGLFEAGVEGVFRRLGDVLSVRNGSDRAEMWTSVSPCRRACRASGIAAVETFVIVTGVVVTVVVGVTAVCVAGFTGGVGGVTVVGVEVEVHLLVLLPRPRPPLPVSPVPPASPAFPMTEGIQGLLCRHEVSLQGRDPLVALRRLHPRALLPGEVKIEVDRTLARVKL